MVYPNPAVGKSNSFKIKQNLLMRLPVFHDLPTEEPNQHLSRFMNIVESMGPDMADPQILKMKAFPFTLNGSALDWLEELPVGYITSWEKLAQEFLQKFYPATRVMNMGSQIAGIHQNATKTYAEYCTRFQKLQKRCPQHGFSKGSLLHFFYQGLHEGEKNLLNSAAGGAYVYLSHDAAEKLIAKGAANELQYGSRASSGTTQGAQSDQRLSNIEQSIEKLNALLLSGKAPKAQVCGICSTQGHFTDACPTLVEPNLEYVNAIGFGNQGANQFSNTYNSRWKDHPNLRYGDTNNALNGFQFQNNSAPSGFLQRQQCITNSQDIREMEKQLGDVIKKINQEHEPGRLPRTTQPNLKFEHANIITTKSGRNVIPTQKVLENQVDKHGIEKDPTTERTSHNKLVEGNENSQAKEDSHENEDEDEIVHNNSEEKHTSPISTGASINVMPSSLYEKLCIKTELKTDGVTILLANRSHVYPKGVLEDVLVQVGRFQYPADFYI
ncbi:uncharacterized protein LOC108221421 [Daucus carota subsp. sativus]|uniref:uncharacterized protein LOC108221421 n=1 Tax=Daucus carota subsp. sativus TaxID=79200 RepID=UPI0007EF3C6A|nr:PREDICTED: uncharacterized protein LOC108221421 [Daucus carota subsp. sativus]